jgi:FkbM family methyltransferase
MELNIISSEPSDDYVIHQTLNEYSCIAVSLPCARVLDIGAHIGCFSVMALTLGATQVISVEPVPISAEHLRKNTEFARDRSIVIEAAAVGGDEETVTLRWLNTTWRSRPPKDYRTHWRGREYQFATAKTVKFKDLLKTYEPNVIKMDCEGAEYDMLQSIDWMPACVNTFTAEWHDFTVDSYDQYIDCINRLWTWGFTTEQEVRMGPKAFNSWGNFIRPIAWRRPNVQSSTTNV